METPESPADSLAQSQQFLGDLLDDTRIEEALFPIENRGVVDEDDDDAVGRGNGAVAARNSNRTNLAQPGMNGTGRQEFGFPSVTGEFWPIITT